MAEGRIQRRLAAILSADVVSYSRLMESDEVGTLARLQRVRADIFDPCVEQYGGRIVKEMGDGLLVEFASVVDAVECAVAVQRSLAQGGESGEERIRYRMGVNLGDIIIKGDDIFGDGVNIAARLQALAEPAGLNISAAVHEQIRRKLDLVCEDCGEQRLKNIEEPIRIFRVRPSARAGSGEDSSQAEGAYREAVKARYGEDATYFIPLSGRTSEGASAAQQRAKSPRSARRHESRARVNYHELIPVGEDIKQVKVDDLREAIERYPCVILLGDPGSGKSTILEALAYAQAERLERLPLLLPLGGFSGAGSVEDFVRQGWGGPPQAGHWGAPELAANLRAYLEAGRLLLLFDALNEMPQEGYRDRCRALRTFIDEWAAKGNRVVVTCRALDYGEELSGLQRIEVERLSDEQIQHFLENELPETWRTLWSALSGGGDGSRLLEMARNPYLLTVMIDVFEEDSELTPNRAALMQRFTEIMLGWAKAKCPPEKWLDAALQVEALSVMAFEMQVRSGFGTTVRTQQIKAVMPQAVQLDPNWPAEKTPPDEVLDLAAQANIVEMPVDRLSVRFYHQILQEYFAARRLTTHDPEDNGRFWRTPILDAEMPAWSRPDNNYEPIPPPPPTGWEETTLLASAMPSAAGTSRLLAEIVRVNPVLASRCMLQPGVVGDPALRQTATQELLRLIARPEVALRARIAAAAALGALGDPRPGEMVGIPAGPFLMGEGREQHEVSLPDFRIGKYPVTNAEYRRFIEAAGYRDRRWWTTAGWMEIGEKQTEPRFWQVSRFNKPNQPAIGLSWYECVAYSRWLSAESGTFVRLPSEAEWEKAARGCEGFLFPWGNDFDPSRLNGRGPRDTQVCTSTPVGIYPTGVSRFGLLDCVGNAWEWCATRWKKPFPYDTRQNEWEDDYLEGQNLRVLRGGSWYDTSEVTRCTHRFKFQPYGWNDRGGFRLVSPA